MIWLWATAGLLAVTGLAWCMYVLGIRHGVRAMYREALGTILVETEKTKLRSAGLIASLDTHVAMLRAIHPKGPR